PVLHSLQITVLTITNGRISYRNRKTNLPDIYNSTTFPMLVIK
ncbi:hypothetical protein X975_05166, partial [Stegodyphus mimosarum]